MREILTQLLDDYASNDDVRCAEWWVEVKEPREGVSKRQKIKFFVVGRRKWEDELEFSLLETTVSEALMAHDEAINVAHGKAALTFEARKSALQPASIQVA
jgi:hypothetical protein